MFRDEFHVFFWGSHDSLHVTQLDLLIFFVDLKKIIWMCQVDHVRCQPSGLRMFGTAEEPWDAALLWDVSFLQWKTMWKRFERTNVGLCWLQDFSDVSAFDSFWLRIQYETHKKNDAGGATDRADPCGPCVPCPCVSEWPTALAMTSSNWATTRTFGDGESRWSGNCCQDIRVYSADLSSLC